MDILVVTVETVFYTQSISKIECSDF